MTTDSANVFVIGLDDHNRAVLEQAEGAERYAFHGILDIDELQRGDEIPVEELLDTADRLIRDAPVDPDAIIGWWDFPVSLMVPVLSARFGLTGPSPEAVLKCEHKWWSRKVQSEVIDEHPDFALVDVHDRAQEPPLAFPFWLKPVKGFSSELAFLVTDDASFRDALTEIEEGIGRVGEPFEHFLDLADVPAAIREAGGTACLAESVLEGLQCTVEGWVDGGGEPHVHGVVDSIAYPDSSSFLRFELPSGLPADVQDRLADVSRRVIAHIGLSHGTFNIEYFVDPDTGEFGLLEINPRHSQSHAPLMKAVHGVVNHRIQLELALGRTPDVPHDEGAYGVAAKWFLRCRRDGVVTAEPSADAIAGLEQRLPDASVNLVAREGVRLSEMHDQDAYSFKLADVHLAAEDRDAMEAQWQECVRTLVFTVDGEPAEIGAAPVGEG